MVIGRAQKCAARATARDGGKIALDRFALHHLHFVRIGLGKSESVRLEKLAIRRHHSVFAELVEGLFRFCHQTNLVALGLCQEKTSQRKDRIGHRIGLHLSQNILEHARSRQKTDGHPRGEILRRLLVLLFAAMLVVRPGAGTPVLRRPIVWTIRFPIAAWTLAIPASARVAISAGRALVLPSSGSSTHLAAARAAVARILALVMLVTGCLSRLFQPGG